MNKSMELLSIFVEFCWWILPKLIKTLAVLLIIWIILSWYDVVSDNVAMDGRPVVDEGNFFVEVMEAVEWFN